MDDRIARRTRTRVVAIGLVGVGALILVAIVAITGVDREGGDVVGPADPVSAVRGAPRKVEGKRVTAAIAFTTSGALQLRVEQNGVFDLAVQRSDTTVSGFGSPPLRVVTDGPTVYVKGPRSFGDKTWARMVGTPDTGRGPGASPLSVTQIGSLMKVLSNVQTAIDKGFETVDGRRLRHVGTTMSPTDVSGISPLFRQVGATSGATLEVYLDSSGTPRRVVVAAAAGASPVEVGATINDIGGAPPVAVPPAEDVAEMSSRDLTAALRP